MQYETNPLKIGNTLNDYFSTIAQKLANKIKTDKKFNKYLDKPNDISFFMTPTDKNEIEKLYLLLIVTKLVIYMGYLLMF